MKFAFKFSILPFAFILFSCGESEVVNQTYEPTEDQVEVVNQVDESLPIEFETEEEKYTHVLEAQVGIYADQALMVLTIYPENEDGTQDVEGYYFYIKHHKNLTLEGQYDPIENRYVLTESYKGKTSGYMDFIPGNEMDSYWAPASDPEDEQFIGGRILLMGDPYELTVAYTNEKYSDLHEIQSYMGEEEGWETEEVKDGLSITKLNEEYLLFDLHVTGRNYHSGSAKGVALLHGNEAIWEGPKDANGCTLYFDLSEPNEITVTEENCENYHGFNASFNSVFTKQ